MTKLSKRAKEAQDINERRTARIINETAVAGMSQIKQDLANTFASPADELAELRRLVKQHRTVEGKALALEGMISDRLVKVPPVGEKIHVGEACCNKPRCANRPWGYCCPVAAAEGGLFEHGGKVYRTSAMPFDVVRSIADTAKVLHFDADCIVSKPNGIRELLCRQPIYKRFLKHTPGLVGGSYVIAAYLIGFIDIRHGGKDGSQTKDGSIKGWTDHNGIFHPGARPAEATKLSHIVRYCGYAGGRDEHGNQTGRMERHTKGVKASFNADLRMRLYQWASVLIKGGGGWAADSKYYRLYSDTKFRLSNDPRYDAKANIFEGRLDNRSKALAKGAKAYINSKAWHKMVHLLLEDLYTVWRAIEGLPVWPSYYSAKLGYSHGGMPTDRRPMGGTRAGVVGGVTDWQAIGPRYLTVEEAQRLVGIDESSAKVQAESAKFDPAYSKVEAAELRAIGDVCEDCDGKGVLRDLRGNQWACHCAR